MQSMSNEQLCLRTQEGDDAARNLLPILPICIAQLVICYAAAVLLGLEVTIHIVTSVLFTLPVALLFVSLGLLCGSIFTDKQVGGICGVLLTNLTA